MNDQDNKLKNYSITSDLIKLILLIIAGLVIGHLFNQFLYGLIFSLSIFIIYILYTNYILEKWLYNFRINKSSSYHQKHQNLVSKVNSDFKNHNIVQEKLLALEKRFEELSESMPDAIVVVNRNFETEWFNKAAVKILSLKEIDIGKPIAHMIRNPSFAEFIRKNNVGSSINFISPLKYDLTIKCFMVPYGEDRSLLTFRDISESDQLDKMRRDFIANVSHELKTPLTVIFGYLETLSFSDDGYVDDDIISEMLKQSKRMDSLISDLLKLTKLQSSDIPDKDFSQINLKIVANEITAACKPEALRNKNNVTILSDNDIFIKGSYEEIYSALINLLSNAIAYSGKNIEIEINYLARNENEVEFYIKDYGAGIPEESVDRLTERFYRIDKGRSREQGGTGLGLSIVKHIMNRHDGKLEIESAINEGSKFTCVFPKT